MADQETRAELNRLYWETDESVSGIADRLGLSRRALYDELEPLPAGMACPACGEELAYRNRTTAESGEAECVACGLELDVEGVSETGQEPSVEQEWRAAPLSPVRRVPATGRGPVLGAALVAGLGVGAVAGYLLRRS